MNNLILIIALLFSSATEKPDCTCLPITIGEKIDLADIIFKAKVLAIDTVLTTEISINYNSDGSKNIYLRPIRMTRNKLKIIQSIKGAAKLDSAFIYTTYECCMCGTAFWPDLTYLVFANQDSIRFAKNREIPLDQETLKDNLQKPEKVLSTSICSGTIEFSKYELKEILRYLHRKKNSR